MLQLVDGLEGSSHVELLCGLEEVLDAWVLRVTSQNLLGLLSLVGPVDILDGDGGEVAVVSEVTEGDAGTGLDAEFVDLLPGNVEGDRDGEEDAVGKADVLDNSAGRLVMASPNTGGGRGMGSVPVVVLLVHETLQGRETTIEDEL